MALVFMLYGHTVSALLAPAYQRGTWFEVWQFQRGLTSSLFLLLAGFAFSVATSRHWGSHQRFSPAVVKRARRFAFFVLLGYALHFPVARFVLLPGATDERWRAFLAVDVLQLIGVTFLLVQALVLVTRSRARFTWTAALLAIAMVAVTHWVWDAGWARALPPWLAAYLSPSTGSLFPLFPLAAYVLFGIVLGQIYVAWGAGRLAAYANVVLLMPGVVLAAGAWAVVSLSSAPWASDPWNVMPIQVAVRMGVCLVILSVVAHASQRLARLPHFFGAVAQETLLIYFLHLCIVYGSVWNSGLAQRFGASLGPTATLACVLLLLGTMPVVGWYWHWLKHARPRVAWWTRVAVTGLLVGRLL